MKLVLVTPPDWGAPARIVMPLPHRYGNFTLSGAVRTVVEMSAAEMASVLHVELDAPLLIEGAGAVTRRSMGMILQLAQALPAAPAAG